MGRSGVKVFVFLAALVLLGVLVVDSESRPACTLVRGADTLKINLDGLLPGDVRAYCYQDPGGRKLRFLLARDSSGKIHTVFDACRQCYKYHEGYTWSHGYVICRYCGNRYRIKQMDTGKASCAPVRLPSKIADNQVTIKVKDVEAGKWLF